MMITDLYDRKLGFWEMFGVSWKIYSKQFKLILILILGFSAINYGANALGGLFIPSEFSGHWAAKVFRSSNLFGFIGALILIALTEQVTKEKPVGWRALWQLVRPAILPALLIQLLFVGGKFVKGLLNHIVSQGLGSLLFMAGVVLVVVVIDIYFRFTYQALLLKGKRGISAFMYSVRAVRGSWWKLFAVRTLFVLPMMLPALVFGVCGPERAVEMYQSAYYPVCNHLFYLLIAVLYGYVPIFYTLFFLNIVQHDVRFAETDRPDEPQPIK